MSGPEGTKEISQGLSPLVQVTILSRPESGAGLFTQFTSVALSGLELFVPGSRGYALCAPPWLISYALSGQDDSLPAVISTSSALGRLCNTFAGLPCMNSHLLRDHTRRPGTGRLRDPSLGP